MKKLLTAALCLAFAGSAFAQKPMDVKGLGRDWVETEFPAGGELEMDLQSGGVHITGSEDGKVRVRCAGPRAAEGTHARVRLETSGAKGELMIHGGPKNNFEIEIQIPRRTDLIVRMPAGELEVSGVTGHKKVHLHAGQLTLQVGDPAEYGHVSGSVWAGEIHGGPFGEGKEGLFRSFRWEGNGKYEIQAKLKAGELRFKR